MEHVQAFLAAIGPSVWFSTKWFIISAVIYIPLSRLFPSIKGQPIVRSDTKADVTYWFLGPFLYGFVGVTLGNYLYRFDSFHSLYQNGGARLHAMPILLQAIIILLITDFLQYWAHRAFHHHPLWRFHTVHHAPVQIDWLTSVRFHPVNIILYSTSVNVLVQFVGFSGEAFAILLPFNMIYSPLVHANLNWTYGPFKYLLASPVFHRWHHTQIDKGGNKNFAPTFPFLDLMFGTFYMPEGEQPGDFGTLHDPVPQTFLGQLAYPFKRRAVVLSPAEAEEKAI